MNCPDPADIEGLVKPWLDHRSFADCYAEYDEVGYIIFTNVLAPQHLSKIRGALSPYLEPNISGRNDFEGLRSNRIYAMLAKSPVFADLVAHPLALAFAESELGTSCLLSACLAINLHPGETVQPWHRDDAHINIPMPHPPYGVSTFWALDDTTSDNGATEVLPGSHRWAEEDMNGRFSRADFANKTIRDVSIDPGAHPDAVKAVMKAGSLMVAKGTLLHRGGANKSDRSRLIITPQYCPGWARPLENVMAGVPRATAAEYPQRVRELIGYSIHPPFMGYVDGIHPDKLLT